jgi:hypothetical protein
MRLGCRWIGGLAVWFQQRKRLRPPAVPGLRSRNSVSSCGRSNDWVGRERAESFSLAGVRPSISSGGGMPTDATTFAPITRRDIKPLKIRQDMRWRLAIGFILRVCSQYFYACALGLERPDAKALPSRPELQTIAAALRDARHATMRFDQKSSTWGAYQRYGRVSDRLLAPSGDDLLPFRKIRRLDGFIRRI